MPRTPAGALRGDGQVLTNAASRPGRQASGRRTHAPQGRWVSRSGLPVPTSTTTGVGASPAVAGRAAARAARRAARRAQASWKRAVRALVALLPPLARGRSAERGMTDATKLKNGMCSLNFNRSHDGAAALRALSALCPRCGVLRWRSCARLRWRRYRRHAQGLAASMALAFGGRSSSARISS